MWRGQLVRRDFCLQKEAVRIIERNVQVFLTRLQFKREVSAAIKIQAWFRGNYVRKEQQKVVRGITLLQGVVRGAQARAQLLAVGNAKVKAFVRKQVGKQYRFQGEAASSSGREVTLGEQTQQALQRLAGTSSRDTGKVLPGVLATLAQTTAYSLECCQMVLSLKGVAWLLTLLETIKSSSSNPDQCILHVLTVLQNLIGFDPLLETVLSTPNLIGTLVVVLQMWRNNDQIFNLAATIIITLCDKDPVMCKNLSKIRTIVEPLQSIHRIISRDAALEKKSASSHASQKSLQANFRCITNLLARLGIAPNLQAASR
jgi:hypothetical protein